MDTNELIEDIRRQGKPAHALPGVEQIIELLLAELRAGDVVAIMSNGGFGGIHDKLLAALRER